MVHASVGLQCLRVRRELRPKTFTCGEMQMSAREAGSPEAEAMATPTQLGTAAGGPAPAAKEAVRAGELLATHIFNRSTASKLGC